MAIKGGKPYPAYTPLSHYIFCPVVKVVSTQFPPCVPAEIALISTLTRQVCTYQRLTYLLTLSTYRCADLTRELIAENIAYDALLTDYPYEQDTLEEILELLVDVVCTTKSSVRISGDDKPAEVVRSRFLKLNSEHIRFVVGGLKENTTRIRNMRQYLLATLYNAPLTIGNYYRSLVSHDMSEGFI